MAEQND